MSPPFPCGKLPCSKLHFVVCVYIFPGTITYPPLKILKVVFYTSTGQCRWGMLVPRRVYFNIFVLFEFEHQYPSFLLCHMSFACIICVYVDSSWPQWLNACWCIVNVHLKSLFWCFLRLLKTTRGNQQKERLGRWPSFSFLGSVVCFQEYFCGFVLVKSSS